jgi:arylformamidase
VDPIDSKDLPAHYALHANGVHILEGLVLDEVEPGDYELISLPLPLQESDGSPVRAMLRTL